MLCIYVNRYESWVDHVDSGVESMRLDFTDEGFGVIDLIYLYSRCTCLRYYRSWPKLAELSEGSTTSGGGEHEVRSEGDQLRLGSVATSLTSAEVNYLHLRVHSKLCTQFTPPMTVERYST